MIPLLALPILLPVLRGAGDGVRDRVNADDDDDDDDATNPSLASPTTKP